MEDAAGRFCLAGFYVRPRELVWLAIAAGAEALLAGYAVASGFSLPALLLLAVPALACWAAFRLRVDGAVIECWVLDMALFATRGRYLTAGRGRPLQDRDRRRIQINYQIACPGHRLRRGHRTARGFRFEASD